jgi:hypothetical protein
VVITLADGQNLQERPLFTLGESDARLNGFSFAATQTHVAKTVEKALIGRAIARLDLYLNFLRTLHLGM